MARNFHPYNLSRELLNRPKNRSGWFILDIFRIFGIIGEEEEKISRAEEKKADDAKPPYISTP